VRLGCSSVTFAPQSAEDSLRRIADLGFTVVDLGAVPRWCDHVQLADPPRGQIQRLESLVGQYRFEVAGLQSVPWYPDSIDDAEELRRRYTVAADVAQAIGARGWLVDPGLGDDADRTRGLDRFKRTITMAAELAEIRGLRLGVEAPNYGTLAETLPQTLELIESADLPHLGIDLDTSHVLNCGSSTAEVLDAIGDRIIHVALRDGYRDGVSCTPGEGDFDFAEFFQLLARTSYVGDATIELIPSSAGASADDRADAAVRARNYLEPLLILPGMP
jgi:sugar phosphate isomerase/epimerase